MLVNTNQTDIKGNRIYLNKLNGKKVILRTGSTFGKGGKIPNGVYGRFIKPAPTELERMMLKVRF